jgi:hypothetical protein
MLMKDTKCLLNNYRSFDRTTRNDFAQRTGVANRDESNQDLEIFRYPFTYFSQGDRQDKQLVSTIQRGNRLKTPALYAELAISFMCRNFNTKIEKT